jgi:thiol-disulfide isomerase/thioredoxin
MKQLLSLVIGTCFIAAFTACGGEIEIVQVGQRAPNFNLVALDGTEFSSVSLEGQPVILNFWATWCQPCLKEIPELKEFAAESNVKLIGIALDKDGARSVKPFVEKHQINYPILLGNEELFQKFNGFGIPHTVILDADYKVVKVYRGTITKLDLENDLATLAQNM